MSAPTELELEKIRIRAFKETVKMLQCKNCGHEVESDLPLPVLLKWKCSRCGAQDWRQQNVGKAVAKDTTAPLEITREEK